MNRAFFESIPCPGLAADMILVLHALFVVFIVGGQALVLVGWARRWRWVRNPWFRFIHLALIAFVVLQTWLGELCPLTVWEGWLREAAGQAAYGQSFIQYWLGRLIFLDLPWWLFQVVYTAFGAVVVVSWVHFPPRRQTARRRPDQP